jgi:hypothetical protein
VYDLFSSRQGSRSGGFQPPNYNNGALESAAPWFKRYCLEDLQLKDSLQILE